MNLVRHSLTEKLSSGDYCVIAQRSQSEGESQKPVVVKLAHVETYGVIDTDGNLYTSMANNFYTLTKEFLEAYSRTREHAQPVNAVERRSNDEFRA